MARCYIDKVSSDEENTYFFIKPSQTSYHTLKDSHDISIYRLFVLPKNNKYIDIYENPVE